MSADDYIVIFTYTRIIDGRPRLVYVVKWISGDIDEMSVDEFTEMVLGMRYTRHEETARRIAEKMDEEYNTEYGIRNVERYRDIQVVSTEFIYPPLPSVYPPLPSVYPPLPPPLPSNYPVYPPLPPPLPSDYPAYVPVSPTSTIAEAKWLMLSKIRELETVLTACRLQLETIDVEL
jgi:hypothetical protein